MQLTNALLALTAAAAVTAHPSMGHRHQHMKKSPVEWYKAVNSNSGSSDSSSSSSASSPSVEGKVKAQDVSTPTTTSDSESSAAPTTSAVEVKTSSAAPAKTSSASTDGGNAFASCKATSNYANSKRATYDMIKYVGELGSPYGCNWQEVSDASAYDYTMTFESPDYDMTCQCWNKIGADGESTGQWSDMFKLSLPKGSKKVVALMPDTQGACACSYGSSVPKGKWGDWLGTWVEMDMGSGINGGQSGADVSALAVMDNEANNGKATDFPGMALYANGRFCSGITANNGAFHDAYVLGNDAADGTKIHDVDGLGCTGYTKNNLRVLLGDVSW